MKTKVCILSIVALLTFGQTQAMSQRDNNTRRESTTKSGNTNSSSSVRSGNTGSSTLKDNNTRRESTTKSSNTTKSSSTSKNNETKAPSSTKKDNNKAPSTSKNNNTRRTTTVREPKSVNPPREIPKGYEDRVRYDGKNWCYLRDGKWYSYDHYIEPATYYSRPLSEFGTALIVGAVVGLISALVN